MALSKMPVVAAFAALFFLSWTDALSPNTDAPRKPGHIRPNEDSIGRRTIPSYTSSSKLSTFKNRDQRTDRIIRKQLDDFVDDEDDVRMYVGTSLGENMNRDYVLDPQGYEMRERENKGPQLRYYKMLGLTMTASQDEIKQSYRRLAKLYHPDANPDKDTSEQFNLLNRAYEVLTDPVLKQRYDMYGKRGVGTSAASDAETSTKMQDTSSGIGRGYVQYQQVARSDMADINWKGSRSNSPYSRITMDLSKNCRTLHEARRQVKAPTVMTQKTQQRDLYAVLSVHKNANDDEIWSAYRKLSQLYYEDRNESKEAYIRYHEVERAFEVLRDPKLRKKYDLLGFQGMDKFRSASPRATIQDNITTQPFRQQRQPKVPPTIIQQGAGARASKSVDPNPDTLSARQARSTPQTIVLSAHQSTIGRSSKPPTSRLASELRTPTTTSAMEDFAEASHGPVADATSQFELDVLAEEEGEEEKPVPFPDFLQPEAKDNESSKEAHPTNGKKTQSQDTKPSTIKKIESKGSSKVDTKPFTNKDEIEELKDVKPVKRSLEEMEDDTSALLREIIDKSQEADAQLDARNNGSGSFPVPADLVPIYDSAAYWRSVSQIDPLPLHDDPVLDKRARIEPVALTGSNNKKKESSTARAMGRSSSARKMASRQLTQMHSMPTGHSSDQDKLLSKNLLTPTARPAVQRKPSTSDQSKITHRAVPAAAAEAPIPSASSKSDYVRSGQAPAFSTPVTTSKRKQQGGRPAQNQSRHYTVDC